MDSQGLAIAAALLAFFSGLGAAIDNLILPHQNNKIRDRLLTWWNFVDDVRFRDVAHTMVSWYLLLERRIFGIFPSRRWVLTSLVLSVTFTTSAVILGRALGLYLTLWCGGNLQTSGGALQTIFTVTRAGWVYFWANVNHLALYALNLSFDFITLATTLFFLRLYVASRAFISRYVLIAADIVACLLFLYSCVFLAFYSDQTTSGRESSLWDFYRFLLEIIRAPDCAYFHFYTSTLLFASSVLFPTLAYLSAIFSFLNAKIALEASRWIVAHVLELGATQQKTVFFYTGVYVGLLASLAKLFQEILKALA